MVTYMEPQTVPSYMSVKFTRRTLRMPNFTRAPHAQPSLSNIPKWDSKFGEPTHSRRTTRLGQNFPTSPQNQNTKLTHCSIYMSIRTLLCCVRTRQQYSATLDYFVTSLPPYLHQFSAISGGNCINYVDDHNGK